MSGWSAFWTSFVANASRSMSSAERVADRGHDDPLVERQVRSRRPPVSTFTESRKPHVS